MREEYENDCPSYLKDYINYIRTVKNHSERTQEAYYIDLRLFLRYLKVVHHDVPKDADFSSIKIADVPFSYVKDFTNTDAYMYLNFLNTERNNSVKTRARKITSLRRFYGYLHDRAKTIDENPVEHVDLPKIPKTLPKYLQLDQSEQLLESISGKNQIRDYCILTLFLNCGMRLSELAGLNIADYSKKSRSLRLFGKGRKERIVYLNDACISALDDYLKVRPKSEIETKAIFLSTHANHLTRLTTRRIQKIVEDQLKIAGLGNLGISVHKLRHTAATLMYEYGNVDILVLKEILGHENLGTTEIYTHLSSIDKKEAAERSPLAKMKNANSNSGEPAADAKSDDTPDK